MSKYDISFIYNNDPTEQYNYYNNIDETAQQLFEGRWCSPNWQRKNIEGLCVYVNKGTVKAVFDYNNLCGWLAK